MIGILTLTFSNNLNYGALLQAWALKHFLQKNLKSQIAVLPMEQGTEEIRDNDNVSKRYPVGSGVINAIRRIAFVWSRQLTSIRKAKRNKERREKTKAFFRTFCAEGRQPFVPADIELALHDVSAIVVGSDWVWYLTESQYDNPPDRIPATKKIYLGFLPKMMKKRKLIAYAASQGIIPERPSSLLQLAMQNFDAISVREVESADYLKKNGCKKEVAHVLDPTLLLEEEDLREIARTEQKGCYGKYILVYCLKCQNKDAVCRYLSNLEKGTGLKVCVINTQREFSYPGVEAEGDRAGPVEFLSSIRNAEYVVTNSFHGMVFSCLYHKPFTAFQRQARDYRQKNLVELLGLRERLLDDCVPWGEATDPYKMPVDWEEVDRRRRAASEGAKKFLLDNLKNADSAD